MNDMTDDEVDQRRFDDASGDAGGGTDVTRLDTLRPAPRPAPIVEEESIPEIKDYNHEWRKALPSEGTEESAETASPTLPLTVLIEHVLPFCDRTTWNDLASSNRTMFRLSKHVSLTPPPWPQLKLWTGPVPLTAAAAWEGGDRTPVLAVGDVNGRIRMWNGRTGHRTDDLEAGHVRAVRAMVFGSGWLASAGDDRSILVWSEETTSPVLRYRWKKTMDGHEDAVTSLGFVKTSELYLASASYDRTVRIWQVSTSKCLKVLNCLGFVIGVTLASTDGVSITLASAELGTSLRVWDVSTVTRNSKKSDFRSSSSSLKALQDGSDDGENTNNFPSNFVRDTISSRILDDRPRRRPTVPRVHCQDIAFTSCGEHLITVSRNGTIRIWRTLDDVCIATHFQSSMHAMSNDTSRCIAVAPGQTEVVTFATGTSMGRIRIYEWKRTSNNSTEAKLSLKQTIRGHRNAIEALAFTTNSRTFMSVSIDKSVKCWNI